MKIEFDLPDVPAPADPFVGYWGKQAFIGHFSDDAFVATLSSTYVRCVFGAREDYLAAAQHIRRVYEPANNRPLRVSDLYRSISRFESCITGMYLAVRSFRALRKRSELTARERKVICEVKPKPRFLGSAGDRIGKLRNKMQHIEEELASGKLEDDVPFMIQITGPETKLEDPANAGQVLKTFDRLRVLQHEVRFSELAAWLVEMVEYVEKLHSLMPLKYTSTEGKTFAPSKDV